MITHRTDLFGDSGRKGNSWHRNVRSCLSSTSITNHNDLDLAIAFKLFKAKSTTNTQFRRAAVERASNEAWTLFYLGVPAILACPRSWHVVCVCIEVCGSGARIYDDGSSGGHHKFWPKEIFGIFHAFSPLMIFLSAKKPADFPRFSGFQDVSCAPGSPYTHDISRHSVRVLSGSGGFTVAVGTRVP